MAKKEWRTQALMRKLEALSSLALVVALVFVAKASATTIAFAPHHPDVAKGDSSVRTNLQASSGQQPSVLIFVAEWCQPCHQMQDAIALAKAKYKAVASFHIMDIDDAANQQMVERYQVETVPAVVCTRPDGTVSGETVGYAGSEHLMKFLEQHVEHRVAQKF